MSSFKDILEGLLIVICFGIVLGIAISAAMTIVMLVYNLLF